ncbi:fused MFS/spermidine synthase [Elusimicrobiota bacterium]
MFRLVSLIAFNFPYIMTYSSMIFEGIIGNIRLMPRYLLALLFFCSGMSGLIYEVVWMRMASRVFGVTVYAVTMTVAIFFGGLALGSWIAGRYVSKTRQPLKIYALLELGIGLSAIIASVMLAHLPLWQAKLHQTIPFGWLDPFTQLIICALVLLAPTVLMGSTLPFGCEYLGRRMQHGEGVSLLYGINTLGAALGALLAGFVFISLLGEKASLGIGIFLHTSIGLFALMYFLRFGDKKPAASAPRPVLLSKELGGRSSPLLHYFLVIVALSGACAMSYEVLWSRFLTITLGTSVYAFAIVLTVYLVGIALGSLFFKTFKFTKAWTAFGWIEIILGLTAFAELIVLRHVGLSFAGPKYLYSPLAHWADLISFAGVAGICLLPMTFLLGILFPIMVSMASGSDSQGASVGKVYAYNTFGGIVGSVLTGFVAIPLIGSHNMFKLAAGANLMIGMVMIIWITGFKRNAMRAKFFAIAVLALFLGVLSGNPAFDITQHKLRSVELDMMFYKEEPAALITGAQGRNGVDKVLLLDGIEVSNVSYLGRALARLPFILLSQAPQRALIVGFGVGSTFRAVLDRDVKADVAELVAGVPEHFNFFYKDSEKYLNDPDARIFIRDGRTHLLAADRRYDTIIIDGSPPIFSAGTVNLYTREFVELAQSRLSDFGILMIWVPLPCFEQDFWMIAKNITETFPHYIVLSDPGLPGIMLMGSGKPFDMSLKTFESRYKKRGWEKPKDMVRSVKVLESAQMITPSQLKARTMLYPRLTDDHPYTEFPLGKLLAGEPMRFNSSFVLHAKTTKP